MQGNDIEMGLPKIGCTSTSAAVIGFKGSGRGFGRKLASSCFFLPGIQTSIKLAHSSEESLGDVTLYTFSFKDWGGAVNSPKAGQIVYRTSWYLNSTISVSCGAVGHSSKVISPVSSSNMIPLFKPTSSCQVMTSSQSYRPRNSCRRCICLSDGGL